jgi:hypothetical protein
LTKKFGTSAWEEFNKIAVDGMTTDLSNMCMDREAALAAFKKGIPFTIEGDIARCVVPWNGKIASFRRASNGAWYSEFGLGGTELIAALWTSTNVGIDAALSKLVENGVTILEAKRVFEQAKLETFKKLDVGNK